LLVSTARSHGYTQPFDCVYQADVKYTGPAAWPQIAYEPVAASIAAG
jgi:hypothetical protein